MHRSMEVVRYITVAGKDIFGEWLASLADPRAAAKIIVRIDRVAAGDFGDCKPLRDGVWELRVDWGPGYRVYYALAGRTRVVLLWGGDKRKQTADIKRAVDYWNDYQQRMSSP
jgi:putative addiction module killer protein